MKTITLEAIQAKQIELDKLIQQFKAQPESTKITYPEVEIELHPGEHYAGPVLDESGVVMYHLVMVAARTDNRTTWQASMDWADSVGGALPNCQEASLLFANCKPYLEFGWHWTSKIYEGNSSYTWCCHFRDGNQYLLSSNAYGAAVAVRKVEALKGQP